MELCFCVESLVWNMAYTLVKKTLPLVFQEFVTKCVGVCESSLIEMGCFLHPFKTVLHSVVCSEAVF